MLRDRNDPDQVWRCCAYWPRSLINKWNAREFAARHGADLPALFWRGTAREEAPFESLPDAFVIRPVSGTMCRGVEAVVGDRELLHGHPASLPELRSGLPRTRFLRRAAPFLIEEFITTEDGRFELPVGYKCHTFGDEVVLVETVRTRSADDAEHRYYTPDWEPIEDPINTYLPPDEQLSEPPRCLERMVEQAATLGAELGTYMRVDFFASERGCIFNEFSSLPLGGNYNTPYCEELFGSRWAEKFPDAT